MPILRILGNVISPLQNKQEEPSASSVWRAIRLRSYRRAMRIQLQKTENGRDESTLLVSVSSRVKGDLMQAKVSLLPLPDKSYWSAGARDEPNYASQQTLFQDVGLELLDHSFAGYNCCIFAYGQTGSGKSCELHLNVTWTDVDLYGISLLLRQYDGMWVCTYLLIELVYELTRYLVNLDQTARTRVSFPSLRRSSLTE